MNPVQIAREVVKLAGNQKETTHEQKAEQWDKDNGFSTFLVDGKKYRWDVWMWQAQNSYNEGEMKKCKEMLEKVNRRHPFEYLR